MNIFLGKFSQRYEQLVSECQELDAYIRLAPTRVFSEVPFWNSAEYEILYGIGFIPRNSA
jgi:hypothetical protein